MGSGGGGSSTNTVQEIPAYEQEESQANQQLANSLASTPYSQYPTGDLISPLTDEQNAGIAATNESAYDYVPSIVDASNTLSQANSAAAQPYMNEANAFAGEGNTFLGQAQNELPWANAAVAAGEGQYTLANQAATMAGANFNAAGGEIGAANSAYGTAQALTSPNAVAGYMSPYIQASLAPQLSDLSLQNAQQQQQINTQATQAGAFGDARQGAAQSLQNYYTDQATNQLTGTAYQNAFSAANQALGNAQNTNVAAGSGYANAGGQFINAGQGYNTAAANYNQTGAGFENAANTVNQTAGVLNSLAGQAGTLGNNVNQIGTTALNQQNTLLNQANAYTALGSANQQLGLTGANAELSAGQLQQTQNQNVANAEYQQYLNATNYPFQMLNVREGAISNSPYNIDTATTLPSPNTTAQGFGAASAAAGLLNNVSKATG
jgi:hypothetical protein